MSPARQPHREGVDGSSPSEGSAKAPEIGALAFRPTCSASNVRWIWITVRGISFTAEMRGHQSPAGFIVLNGTVTGDSFAGAQIHQRSDFVDRLGSTSRWTGDLTLMPASA